MGTQLTFDAPGIKREQPNEDQRLNARLAAGDQVKRARREGRRYLEARCPACGEKVVVLP